MPIYLSRPTASEPELAPAGTDLLYILVPCPALESGVDWSRELPGFRKKVFDRLSCVGLDNLEERILAETVITPETFRERYNLTQGSAFGLAATLLQSGLFGPPSAHGDTAACTTPGPARTLAVACPSSPSPGV